MASGLKPPKQRQGAGDTLLPHERQAWQKLKLLPYEPYRQAASYGAGLRGA